MSNESRIQSLEQTRAIHADLIEHLRTRIVELSRANEQSHADRQAFAKSVHARIEALTKRVAQLEHLASDATRQFELIADIAETTARKLIDVATSQDQREIARIRTENTHAGLIAECRDVIESRTDQLAGDMTCIKTCVEINAESLAKVDQRVTDLHKTNAELGDRVGILNAFRNSAEHAEYRNIADDAHKLATKLAHDVACLRAAMVASIRKPEPAPIMGEFVQYVHAGDLFEVIKKALEAVTRKDAPVWSGAAGYETVSHPKP